MNRLYPLFSIISWGLAPVFLKTYLSDVDIFTSLSLILLFSGLPTIFNQGFFKNFFKKSFLLDVFIISFLTIIHYLGNFYGILYGSIILTTLIIKNSPFFQTIIYSIMYKKSLKIYSYIIIVFLIFGIYLLNYTPDQVTATNILFIIIPILSSLAWAFLMIKLSKTKNEQTTLGGSNIISGLIVFIIGLSIGETSLHIVYNLSIRQYVVCFFLGVIPTLLGPLLRAKAIHKIGEKVIILDYITPIITIVCSLIIFENKLNIYNYSGIVVIIGILFLKYIFQTKTKKVYEKVTENISMEIINNFNILNIR